MELRYFETIIGPIECHIEDGRLISSLPYASAIDLDSSLFERSRSEYPCLASAFRTFDFSDIEPVLVHREVSFAPNYWEVLASIPLSNTLSYSAFTALLGLEPNMVRAVANQLGRNPHIIINPCHRVVRSDGSLGGYKWGLEKKAKLLWYEKSLIIKWL